MSSKTRLPLFGGMVIVIVLVLFFAFTNDQPADEEASGAIGAAEKYRTEQITEEDVELYNAEFQILLQNDDVLRLLQDEEFRRVVASDDFARFIAKEDVIMDFNKTLRSPEYDDFVISDFNNNEANRTTFFSDDFALTLRDKNHRADIISGDFSNLMRETIFQKGPFLLDFANVLEVSKVVYNNMNADDFAMTLKEDATQKAILANDMKYLKSIPHFNEMLNETAFANLMASPKNREYLVNDVFMNALFDVHQREYILSPVFHRLMVERHADVVNADFLNGLTNPEVSKFMQLGEFSDFMMNSSAREFFLDNDLANFLASPHARENITTNAIFYRTLADPDFAATLSAPHKRAFIGSDIFSRMLVKWDTESSIK